MLSVCDTLLVPLIENLDHCLKSRNVKGNSSIILLKDQMFEPQVHSLLRKDQSENSVEHIESKFLISTHQKIYMNNCD